MKKAMILLLGALAAATLVVAAETKDPKKANAPAATPAPVPAAPATPVAPTPQPTITLMPPAGTTSASPIKISPVAPGQPTTVVPGQPVPAAPAAPGGTVEIKERSWDAGTVERGGPVTHAFILKNVGKYDLTVDAKPG